MHVVLLALTAVVTTYFLIGDFDIRLGNASSDDGLVAYAYYFKYPQRFSVDALLTTNAPAALLSMMNWLPALAFRYFDVEPEIFYLVFTYAQNVLLALSVFYLAMQLVKRPVVAWLSALFVLAFRPHWMNPAVYGDLDWMPYAAHLATPLVLFSIGTAVKGRRWAALILLLTAGLIHPLVGLFNAGILVSFWTFTSVRVGAAGDWARWTLRLAAVTTVFMAPPLILSLATPQVPSAELLPLLLANGHVAPWLHPGCEFCIPGFITGLVAFGAFGLLAWHGRHLGGETVDARTLLLACLAVGTASVAIHFIGYMLGSAGVLRLLLHRSPMLLVLCATPLVVGWCWHTIERGRFPRLVVATRVLIAPSLAVLLLAIPTLWPDRDGASQARGSWLPRPAAVWRAAGYALFAFALLYDRPGTQAWVITALDWLGIRWAVGGWFDLTFYRVQHLWWLAVAGFGFLWLVQRSSIGARLRRSHPTGIAALPAFAGVATVCLLIVATVWINQQRAWYAPRAFDGEAAALNEVQRWARNSTRPGDAFIVAGISVHGGWRNYTRRPVVSVMEVGGVYFYPRTAVVYNLRLAEFYAAARGELPRGRSNTQPAVRLPQAYFPSYLELDGQGLKRFTTEFGGRYVVRRAEWPSLDLPEAFRNAKYVVYDITSGEESPRGRRTS